MALPGNPGMRVPWWGRYSTCGVTVTGELGSEALSTGTEAVGTSFGSTEHDACWTGGRGLVSWDTREALVET